MFLQSESISFACLYGACSRVRTVNLVRFYSAKACLFVFVWFAFIWFVKMLPKPSFLVDSPDFCLNSDDHVPQHYERPNFPTPQKQQFSHQKNDSNKHRKMPNKMFKFNGGESNNHRQAEKHSGLIRVSCFYVSNFSIKRWLFLFQFANSVTTMDVDSVPMQKPFSFTKKYSILNWRTNTVLIMN